MKLNKDNIRYWINKFNNDKLNNVYEIETALMIYELFDKDNRKVTNDEIEKVGDFICEQDNIFDEYIRDEIRNMEICEEQENEEDLDNEKDY